MTDKTTETKKIEIKKKRPSKGQATHVRRMKQEARKNASLTVHK